MSHGDLGEVNKQKLMNAESEGFRANQSQLKEKELKEKDAKNALLSQILDQPARARLNTLMLGKPEKGRMIENMLIQMAQIGQITTRIGEKDLIGLLENVGNKMQSKSSVKFDRRRAALDSDDEDF